MCQTIYQLLYFSHLITLGGTQPQTGVIAGSKGAGVAISPLKLPLANVGPSVFF